jgi:predicted ABC-class ATPase
MYDSSAPDVTRLLDQAELASRLREIDGRPYGRYASICGDYQLQDFILRIERVQRDPFAPPTLVHIFVPDTASGFAPDVWTIKSRRIGLCDFLARRIWDVIHECKIDRKGSGNSGVVDFARPGQEIIERTSVQHLEGYTEARLYVGLPANGRRINCSHANSMLLALLPEIVKTSMLGQNLDPDALQCHLAASEDQDAMRSLLPSLGLICFVADGAMLPRVSGDDDRPMDPVRVIPFRSPEKLSVKITLPNRGTVVGMGISAGVTLVTGGGFHGKSTLLRAVERGIYNHIPGDGRELVATVSGAVKVLAEEGRCVHGLDIRPFIDALPLALDASRFATSDASGSTSQAASIVEYLCARASVLLMDEDSSATNFLMRDRAMSQLVQEANEPIRPFVRFVRALADTGVSTLMAVGGTGVYFGQAHCVLRMTNYCIEDVTEEAHRIATKSESHVVQTEEVPTEWQDRIPSRWDNLDRKDGLRFRIRGDNLSVGTDRLSLAGLEQLSVYGQNEAVGHALVLCAKLIDGQRPIAEIIQEVDRQIAERGLDAIAQYGTGRMARPRDLEIFGALCRARKLRFS